MKIGLLSYPLNNNYGCYLQAYALMTILQRMGHDVVYIHRRHNKPRLKSRILFFIRTIKNNVRNGEWKNPFYRYEWLYMVKKGKQLLPFFEKNIPHTQAFYNSKELEKNCQSFDAIIVGSDQVWRAGLLHNITDYYFSFLKNPHTKRISYAASFGKKEAGYTKQDIIKCGELIQKFNAVSVREEVGMQLIKDFKWTCPPPQVVLDPTLLLNKKDYLRLINPNREEKLIMCYILDKSEEKNEVINNVSNELGLKTCCILDGSEKESFQYPPIEKWLEMFYNARFVITDSFHGTVFSILFNIPFIVICNHNRGGDRIISLLSKFGLTDRLYNGANPIAQINSPIKWEEVNIKLNIEKKHSLCFLSNALK